MTQGQMPAAVFDKQIQSVPSNWLMWFLRCLPALVFLGVLQAGAAAPRGPRVEVSCPAPPVPVMAAMKRVLVYELHVTNFGATPLVFERLDVFKDAGNETVLVSYPGSTLAPLLVHVGSGEDVKEPNKIDPGQRVIVFLWIAVDPEKTLPKTLRHRLVFQPDEPNRAAEDAADEYTLGGFIVPVSRETVPVLGSPFRGGTWLAGNGPSNTSRHRRSITALNGRALIGQRYAIDWVKIGPNGDSKHDDASRNENWWGFGEPVLAVADGEVTEAVDGIAENTPRVPLKTVTLQNIAGNHVTMRISPTRYVTFAHLQEGSIKVHVHDHVHRGEVIGRLGNTGNTSGPHLHLQVSDGNSFLASEGQPYVFESFEYQGLGNDWEMDKHPSVLWLRSIPVENAVIVFLAKQAQNHSGKL